MVTVTTFFLVIYLVIKTVVAHTAGITTLHHYILAFSIIVVPMFLLKLVTIVNDKVFSPVLPLEGTVVFHTCFHYVPAAYSSRRLFDLLLGSILSELNQRYQHNNSWKVERMVNEPSKYFVANSLVTTTYVLDSYVVLGVDVVSCDLKSFSNLWSTNSFAPPDFLKGLDKTSLLGSSMSVGDKHFVVSASGFGKHYYFLHLIFYSPSLKHTSSICSVVCMYV